LVGRDGSAVALTPVGYEFPAATDADDAIWLVVRGDVAAPGGSWSFSDPCLLTYEARALADWLRRAAAGEVPPRLAAPPGEDAAWEPDLTFLEPNVAFSLAGVSAERARLRVHFSLESFPPWLDKERSFDLYAYSVEIDTTRAAVLRAASEWEVEIAAFPRR